MSSDAAAMKPLVPDDRYVALIDILGWGAKVVADLPGTSILYDTLLGLWRTITDAYQGVASIRIFSDSVLIVSKELAAVLQSVNSLQFTALANDCLLRGGIAFGKHAEREQDSQLHIVSVPLVLAARVEKTIRVPAIGIHETAMPRFEYRELLRIPVFQRSLLFFRNMWIVNPFNIMWGASAGTRVQQLREEHPEHRAKYEWFLDLYEAVKSGASLIP